MTSWAEKKNALFLSMKTKGKLYYAMYLQGITLFMLSYQENITHDP